MTFMTQIIFYDYLWLFMTFMTGIHPASEFDLISDGPFRILQLINMWSLHVKHVSIIYYLFIISKNHPTRPLRDITHVTAAGTEEVVYSQW